MKALTVLEVIAYLACIIYMVVLVVRMLQTLLGHADRLNKGIKKLDSISKKAETLQTKSQQAMEAIEDTAPIVSRTYGILSTYKAFRRNYRRIKKKRHPFVRALIKTGYKNRKSILKTIKAF